MAKVGTLNVNESPISVIHQNEMDYISLTDMTVSFKEGSGLIGKWITNKNTLEYLGVWEKIKNPDFNYSEFGVIGQDAHLTGRLVDPISKEPDFKYTTVAGSGISLSAVNQQELIGL